MKDGKDSAPLVNDRIRAPKLQLISHDGENLGVVAREEAVRMAAAASLDLVVIAENGGEGVPVAKIMDFGKVLYAKRKKQAEGKKHHKVVSIKEVKMRPKIGEHDYMTKIKQAVKFLQKGSKLKVTIMFRGREMATKRERGLAMFDRIDSTFTELGVGDLLLEKESRSGPTWSRMYQLKSAASGK